ncbi:MAG: prenyltransferase [Bacteroidetes bacterium]|nr:MAG: prenyltransferase [Bacteroidota bacterium]
MIAFLKLIRLPNLLIIAFTQYMIRLCLVEPILNLSGLFIQMSDMEFALLVLATVFIAAGGYVINDYFDVRIDNINKPDQLVIDHGVKRRVAMGAHAVLSFLGVAMGIFLAWKCNILMAGGTLFTVSVIGLWFYSTLFKYQFLSGNIVISLFTGMVPFMVALFEVPRIILTYNSKLVQQQHDFGSAVTDTLLLWAGAYGITAFGLSLIREIIKDMEDVEGDKEYGCRTIPIVLGMKKAKAIVLSLILLFMTGIGCIQYIQLAAKDKYSFLYFLAFIQLPLLFVLVNVIAANVKKNFHIASILVKCIMLTGICYLLMLKFVLLKE